MEWIGLLLILLVIGLLGFCVAIVLTMRSKNLEQTSSFLAPIVRIVLIATVVGYLILGMVQIVAYIAEPAGDILESNRIAYPLLLSLKLMVEVVFYAAILWWADRLLRNLSAGKVFEQNNANWTKNIGQAFLLLFVVEAVGALFLSAAIFLSSGGTFELRTSSDMFLRLIIGLILLIVSRLYERSIRLDEENRLTI